MNVLSYCSICDQSLNRFDMANDMFKWSRAMSQRSLKKRNFRQLKKFLQKKGWTYERRYPFKGKGRATVKLLSIVRQNSITEFNKTHKLGKTVCYFPAKAKPFNDRKEVYGDKEVFGGKLVSLVRELTSQENPKNAEFLLGQRRAFARVTTEEIIKSLIEERAGVKLKFSSDCEALSPEVHSAMLTIVQTWIESSDEVQSLLSSLDKEFGLKLDLEKKE